MERRGFIGSEQKHSSVHVRSVPARIVPLLVFGLCGIAGVAVDTFDILTVLLDGPRWLHQLDLVVAVAGTALLGAVDAYHRRRD